MMLLSPPSPSRVRTACASSRVLASFSKVSWLAARPNKPSSPSWRIVSSRSGGAHGRQGVVSRADHRPGPRRAPRSGQQHHRLSGGV
jgi:hypothetical protein